MLFSPVQAASGECTAAGDVIRLLFLQTSGTQLLSFPSKANSRHSSSQNISEGETQTDRLTDRQTDRDTERQMETDRGRQRQITKRERNQETRLVSLNDEVSYSS